MYSSLDRSKSETMSILTLLTNYCSPLVSFFLFCTSQCISYIKGLLPLNFSGDLLQTPKATVEIKELKVDISKDGASKPTLFVKLHLLPIVAHLGGARVSSDQSSSFSGGGCISANQASSAIMERASAPFSCEEFSLSCEFGHVRFVFMYQYSFGVESSFIYFLKLL